MADETATLRIAACQILTGPDVPASLEKVLDRLREAAAGGARIVSFPEGALFGYCCRKEYWDAADPSTFAAAEQKIGATRLLPFSVPVSFATFGGYPGVVKTLEAINALKANPALGDAFVSSRFVAATNPQNEGSFIEQ